MFVKLKKNVGSSDKRQESGLLPTDSIMVKPAKYEQLPQLSQLPQVVNVRNINLSELRPVENKKFRLISVEHNRKGEIELFENRRDARDQRVREASIKLKIKIADQTPDSRTGTTQTPIRARSRNQPLFQIDRRQNRSFDTAMLKNAIRATETSVGHAEEYLPKHKFKPVETKNILLVTRKEDFNENVFDSLTTEVKNTMFNSVHKYIFGKGYDNERIQLFAKLVVNGLYVNKFINKKENMYTPQKVMLPKYEVNFTYTGS
jgi:hypothetical protein